MSDENERRSTAREEFEQARERYFRMREQERELRQKERELRHKEREQERAAHREERDRAREERRSLRDEIRRSLHTSLGGDLSSHIGRTIRDSMNFSFDLGDVDVGGEEYSEVIERDFTVGAMPRLLVRNISGDTRISVGDAGTIHVKARKRVRGTSEERAKRLLENVEVRMEQDGDDVMLKPHLYEQDRGWADLFRGGRVAVDFEITVPPELRLEAQTVSGDLVAAGTRGPIDAQSVSGDVRLSDVQGPLRLKTVSGDATVEDFAGQLVGNTVSGDLGFDRVRLHGSEIVTVSGEIRIEGELEKAREHRMKTISGDVDLRLTGGSYDIRFKSMSGDLDSEIGGDVDSVGRRDKHIVIGAAETKVTVKTMSGDLEIRSSGGAVPETSPQAEADQPEDVERTEPMEPPAPPVPPAPPRADVRELLERVARGELDVDAAAAALDATRVR